MDEEDLTMWRQTRKLIIGLSWGALAVNVVLVVQKLRDAEYLLALSSLFVCMVIGASLRLFHKIKR